MTLGQEFGGYAQQAQNAISRVHDLMKSRLIELALGGTAIGQYTIIFIAIIILPAFKLVKNMYK